MKRDKFLSILLWGSVLWFVVGITASWKNYASVWFMNTYNSFTKEDRDTLLYGADYEAYKLLADTPEDVEIIYLIPEGYYYPKALLFLYPRRIYPVVKPQDVTPELLKDKDYLLIFISGSANSGTIGNLNSYQRLWPKEAIFELDKKLSKAEDNYTLDDFVKKITHQKGILLYKLMTEKK
jgi:hypothetical protein